MKTTSYDFEVEPIGERYRALISFLAESGSAATVVRRRLPELGPQENAFLEKLAGFVVEDDPVFGGPWGQHVGEQARQLRFPLVPETIELLQTCTDRLHGWRPPDLPQDLHVYRANGRELMGMNSFVRDAWLMLTDVEARRLSGILQLKPTPRTL